MILTFIYYNNEFSKGANVYFLYRETEEYFRFEKFSNISVMNKELITERAVNSIDYDFYDYLHFLLEDRLFVPERSVFKAIGVFRMVQKRVELDDCIDSFTGT